MHEGETTPTGKGTRKVKVTRAEIICLLRFLPLGIIHCIHLFTKGIVLSYYLPKTRRNITSVCLLMSLKTVLSTARVHMSVFQV